MVYKTIPNKNIQKETEQSLNEITKNAKISITEI